MLFRVVINEKPTTKAIIHEDINSSQMLELYAKYVMQSSTACYEFKIFKKEGASNFWKIHSIYQNGEMIQAFDVKREVTPKNEYNSQEPLNLSKPLKALLEDSAPATVNNIISVICDYILGEDSTESNIPVSDWDATTKRNIGRLN